MNGYQKIKKENEDLKQLVREISNHLWDAMKTATNETRENIQRALRAIHMYETK